MVGAVMRHSGAGLAIPTFPLAFGAFLPRSWDLPIAIHFSHRIWALAVLVLVFVQLIRSSRRLKDSARFAAQLTFSFVILQIVLGALIIWTGRATIPTTLHVLNGALVLAGSFSCVLWAWHGE